MTKNQIIIFDLKINLKKYFKLIFLTIVSFNVSCNSESGLNKSDSELLFSKKQMDSLYVESDSLYQRKNYSPALNKALNLLEIAKNEKDLDLVSKTNYLIGKIWHETKSYAKAITYFKTSLKGFISQIELNDSLNDKKSPLDQNYNYLENNFNIGKSYHRLFDEKLEVKDSVKTTIYKDSTLYYYRKVQNSKSFKGDIELLKARVYNNLSGFYMREQIFDKAEEFALKSLEIKERQGDQLLIASGYNTLSNIQFFKKDYETSKKYLKKGLEALEKIKGEKADEIKAGLYYNLAYSSYLLKDYRAYEQQESSWELYRKLEENLNEKKVAEIYANKNYENGIKEGVLQEEIKRQKVLYQKQKAQDLTWIIGISGFSIIVLLIFLLNQYNLRQKNLGLELSKQDLLQQQRLEKIKSESQIKILNATLDGKESERKEIAETLHDSVSALLSSANLHLQACKKQFNGSTPMEVDKSQSIINEASQKIRDLSHTLVSSILLKFGLAFAIKDFAEKYSNSQLQIDIETKYIKRYDQGFEIKLYNIIQEFVNNILKHSNASHASISLIEKNKKIILEIKDNGNGFDNSLIQEKDGLGINQIDARIHMMEGKFIIETSKGKGTCINIELPVCDKVLTKLV